MDLFDAIGARASYRGPYASDPVPQETLRRIVQAGIDAPSGCNAQSTTCVIVDDPALVQEVTRIVGKDFLAPVPAYLVCATDPQPVYQEMAFYVEDCAAMVENMLLAITGCGLASVWLDGVLRAEGRAEALGSLLHIPPHRTVRVVLPVGTPQETPVPREKKSFEERAWFNRHGDA